MPLQFDERGLLPPGIHDATLAEIDEAFGRFQRTDRRIILLRKLKSYLVLPPELEHLDDIRPFEYNVMSKQSTKREYEIEIYPAIAGSHRVEKMVSLFSQVRVDWSRKFGWPTDLKKGIVRIVP